MQWTPTPLTAADADESWVGPDGLALHYRAGHGYWAVQLSPSGDVVARHGCGCTWPARVARLCPHDGPRGPRWRLMPSVEAVREALPA